MTGRRRLSPGLAAGASEFIARRGTRSPLGPVGGVMLPTGPAAGRSSKYRPTRADQLAATLRLVLFALAATLGGVL